MGKATKRQFLVTVEGIPGTWRTMSGGGATAEYSRDYSGGSSKPDLLSGPQEHEDIELVRTFDPDNDPAWIAKLKKNVGRYWATVSKQATDQNFTKVGKPTTYPSALLVGLAEPETDAGSSDPSEITLTFATTGPA